MSTDLLLEGIRAETASMAGAFAKLYDALDRIPDVSRTVCVDQVLTSLAWARDAADLYLTEQLS